MALLVNKMPKFSGEVEIDESLFGHHKYHRGRLRPSMQTWVLGIYSRQTKLSRFFVVYQKRTEEVLLPYIYKNVQKKSIIYTDCWRAYNKLSVDYTHKTVNHDQGFVDKVDRTIHTQGIEATWNVAKKQFRNMNGCDQQNIQMYLDAYSVYKLYNGDIGKIMDDIFKVDTQQ